MKKILRILAISLVSLLVIANLIILFTGNTFIYKTLYYQNPDIDDFTIFNNRTVSKGQSVPFSVTNEQYSISQNFRSFLEEKETTALLVIQNDTVLYEEYWDGYHADSISASFSVAKSIVSILTGIAIEEGKIKNVHQPVSDYIPAFTNDAKSKVTIEHLLNMTAGFDWDESYASLFSPTTKAYYGTDLTAMVERLDVKNTPGTIHEYQSICQVVLAMILEKATGKNISEYASEKLWKPLGAENDALWSLDHADGIEKAYCCFNSTARDFSRIGLLYLHHGEFNGHRIVSDAWIQKSVQPCAVIDSEGKVCNYYGYSWWLSQAAGESYFYARGILGQYVIVVPGKNMVIVRLGKQRPDHQTMQASDYLVTNIIHDFSL